MRTYRPGATVWPLLAWTLLVALVAVLLERHALTLPRGTSQRWLFQLSVTACVVLGPLAFIAHLARRLFIHVTLDRDRGLVFSRGRVIPWGAIATIEHRPGPFSRPRKLPLESLSGVDGCLWVGVAGEGCFAGLAIGMALMAVLSVGYYVLLPVFSLLSPWHSRVIIRLRDGHRIVLRDLQDDEDFVASAMRHVAA